jgi:hypothetical protein
MRTAALLACLLCTLAPAQAQVTAGPEELLSLHGSQPAIAVDDRGRFVVVWTEKHAGNLDIVGTLLPRDGGSPGPVFPVNADTAGTQKSPVVAIGPDGFLVAWENGEVGRENVFGQAFTLDGARKGVPHRLSRSTAGPQLDLDVAALDSGGYVAVWSDRSAFPSEVVARRLSAEGTPRGPEMPMPLDGEYAQGGAVTAYPGGFVVGWSEGVDCSAGRPSGGLAAVSRFDDTARRVGKVYRVGSFACGANVSLVSLQGSSAGALAILWSAEGYFAQRFNPSSGDLAGRLIPLRKGPVCVNGRCEFLLTAAMDDRGRFVVAWEVIGPEGADSFFQVYTARGRALTEPIPISTVPFTNFETLTLALANDGTLAVAWRDGASAPNREGLFLRRFQLP